MIFQGVSGEKIKKKLKFLEKMNQKRKKGRSKERTASFQQWGN